MSQYTIKQAPYAIAQHDGIIKKNLFLICLLFFCSTLMFAQNIKGGLHLGLGGSQIDGDNFGGYHKFSFEVGGFAQIPLKNNFFFQMELLLSQKGSTENPNYLKGTTDMYSANLTYLSIPLLFQYQYKAFMVELGPGVEFLMASKEKIDGHEVTGGVPWNKVSLFGVASLKYQLNEHFSVFFRGIYSLFNSRTRSFATNSLYISGYGQFNNVILVGLDYTF